MKHRERCWRCGKQIALTKSGLFRTHKHHFSAPSWSNKKCEGAGTQFISADEFRKRIECERVEMDNLYATKNQQDARLNPVEATEKNINELDNLCQLMIQKINRLKCPIRIPGDTIKILESRLPTMNKMLTRHIELEALAKDKTTDSTMAKTLLSPSTLLELNFQSLRNGYQEVAAQILLLGQKHSHIVQFVYVSVHGTDFYMDKEEADSLVAHLRIPEVAPAA